MKKVLKAIVWILAALVVIFVGGGYLLPNEVSLQRQTVVNAPPHKVFALVSGYKRFNEWSPWAELDPKAVYTFEGPESGVGAKMKWASNDPNVGAGSQTITPGDGSFTLTCRLVRWRHSWLIRLSRTRRT